MKPFGAKEAAAAFVLFSAAASANAAEGHPFLPYLPGKADYTIPQAVEAACKNRRLAQLLEGLGIEADCSAAGQQEIVAELRERQVVKKCEELTRDGKILVASYNSDGTRRRASDISCEGHTFWGFTDAQRQDVIKWLKTDCLNDGYPDAGYPPENQLITRLKENMKEEAPPPKEAPYCSNNRQNFDYDSRGIVISPRGVQVYSEEGGLQMGSESCDLGVPKK